MRLGAKWWWWWWCSLFFLFPGLTDKGDARARARSRTLFAFFLSSFSLILYALLLLLLHRGACDTVAVQRGTVCTYSAYYCTLEGRSNTGLISVHLSPLLHLICCRWSSALWNSPKGHPVRQPTNLPLKAGASQKLERSPLRQFARHSARDSAADPAPSPSPALPATANTASHGSQARPPRHPTPGTATSTRTGANKLWRPDRSRLDCSRRLPSTSSSLR